MAAKAYLAIDIGASSGRHILGWLEGGRIEYEEVHRFPNGAVKKGGELCWDVGALFGEILRGMKKCAEIGKIPESVGIDTWGVDFVLLGGEGKPLGEAVAYRDSRTNGMDAESARRWRSRSSSISSTTHGRLSGMKKPRMRISRTGCSPTRQ